MTVAYIDDVVVYGVELPCIDDIRRLAPEMIDIGQEYWLRTRSWRKNWMACVWDDGDIDSKGIWKTAKMGVRPVLLFSSVNRRKENSKIRFGGRSFTIIEEGRAICDECVATAIFDSRKREYEDSSIRRRLNKWYERKVWEMRERNPEDYVGDIFRI